MAETRQIISADAQELVHVISVSQPFSVGILTADQVPIDFNAQAYEGPYSVRPKTFAQVLNTQDKRMLRDVTVTEIPYYQTSNPKGGYTVIIGD